MMLLQVGGLDFRSFILYLQDIGAYDVILPFLLVFAIVFAILEKTKIFGDKKTNVNFVVSFVIGLLLVAQQQIVQTINLFLPRVALIIVVALAALLVLSMLAGKEAKGFQGAWFGIIAIVAIIFIVLALNPDFNFLSQYDKDRLFAIAIPLIVMLAAIWIIVGLGSPPREGDGGIMKFLKSFDSGMKP